MKGTMRFLHYRIYVFTKYCRLWTVLLKFLLAERNPKLANRQYEDGVFYILSHPNFAITAQMRHMKFSIKPWSGCKILC